MPLIAENASPEKRTLESGMGLAGAAAWGVWGGLGKNDEKMQVSRMKFSIVEILSGLQENMFSLSRRPQLHFDKKNKKKY